MAKDAAGARDADRLDEAVSLYQKALALKPRWAEGWWSLGTLEYDFNGYAAAAKSFRHVVELTPKHGTAWVMLGLCQFELRQDDEALKSLETGRALGIANDTQLYNVMVYHIGLLQLRKEMYASALKTFQKLAADGVRTDEVALGLAMSVLMIQPSALPAENTPGHAGVVGVGRSVLMIQPSALPAENTPEHAIVFGVGRAEALSAEGKFQEARQTYLSLVQEYPDYPGLHFAYGRFLLAVDEPEKAVAQFQAELRINPNHVIALLQIAAVRSGEDPAEAVEYAKKAVALSPRLPFGRYLLGQFYLEAGNAAAAVPELEQARRYLPNEPKVHFALGRAYAKIGRKEEAAQARALFLRLQAQEKNESALSVYGRESLGLPPEKLALPGDEKPQEQR